MHRFFMNNDFLYDIFLSKIVFVNLCFIYDTLFFQTRINALVEQEVKRRMFEEKRQRENLRKQEREKEKFERDLEIQTLKEQHSRELKQLRAKYESTQELSRFENVIHARMYTRNVKFEFRLYACNSVTLYSDL